MSAGSTALVGCPRCQPSRAEETPYATERAARLWRQREHSACVFCDDPVVFVRIIPAEQPERA